MSVSFFELNKKLTHSQLELFLFESTDISKKILYTFEFKYYIFKIFFYKNLSYVYEHPQFREVIIEISLELSKTLFK